MKSGLKAREEARELLFRFTLYFNKRLKSNFSVLLHKPREASCWLAEIPVASAAPVGKLFKSALSSFEYEDNSDLNDFPSYDSRSGIIFIWVWLISDAVLTKGLMRLICGI